MVQIIQAGNFSTQTQRDASVGLLTLAKHRNREMNSKK
jgi:hypothetical protein